MGGYPLGYPDIRQDFRGKWTSASASASAGGYPLALADIRQRIADIHNGYPETSSRESDFITFLYFPIFGAFFILSSLGSQRRGTWKDIQGRERVTLALDGGATACNAAYRFLAQVLNETTNPHPAACA
ncbi:hypothetical protein PGT21_006089 [Puccinia graminis f. sp. tritici]|uniref:Uncharacterized protein n=1 Tax=Puccinia graminis f. sp. tritici TaxID=56615 RepID=A0A5B0MRV1_PUCGR|nr:hypothetical protein PGT21_006089 [Puccinia graminis f. sp. tritici]